MVKAVTTTADVLEISIVGAGTTNSVYDVAAQEQAPEPKLKAPLPPRKSYYRDHIKTVAAQNPGLGRSKIKTLVASMWEALSEEERTPYQDRYKALKKQYRADVAAYDARSKARVQADDDGPVLTFSHSETERSTSPTLPRPLLQPTEQQTELQIFAPSVLPSPLPQPTVGVTEPDISMPALLHGPPRQPTECLDEGEMPYFTDEMVEQELGPRPKLISNVVRLYCQAVSRAIKDKFPGILGKDIRRVASSHWKSLSEEDRQPFNDRYCALKKQHKIDVAAYEGRKRTLLSTYRDPVLVQFDVELERELGPKPMRLKDPRELYILENARERLREDPGLNDRCARKGLFAMWERASREERQSYLDRFRALLKSYNADIAAYDDRIRGLLISAYGEPESSSSSDALERMLGCRPKIPPNAAFYLYYSDSMMDIMESNPGISVWGAERFATAQWSAASKEVRQAYKDRFSALEEQYKIDSAAYDARERNILKAAIRKLCGPSGSSTTNTAQSAQDPATDIPALSALPPPLQHPVSPISMTSSPPRLSARSLPTSPVPPESSGLLPSLPAPIESAGSLVSVGSSPPSLAAHPFATPRPVGASFSDKYFASELELVATAAANALVALGETSPALAMPAESVELPTPSGKKLKNLKCSASGDAQEPSDGHRKKKRM